MENKRTRRKIFCDYKDNLSCVKKIIKYQEQLYNKVYRDGKWIRRRRCHTMESSQKKHHP